MMVIAYKQGRSHRGILGIRGSLWEPPGGPTGERPHFLYCTGALWALLGQIRGLSGESPGGRFLPEVPPTNQAQREAPRAQGRPRGPRGRSEGPEGDPRAKREAPQILFNCTGHSWVKSGDFPEGGPSDKSGAPRGRPPKNV